MQVAVQVSSWPEPVQAVQAPFAGGGGWPLQPVVGVVAPCRQKAEKNGSAGQSHSRQKWQPGGVIEPACH